MRNSHHHHPFLSQYARRDFSKPFDELYVRKKKQKNLDERIW